MLFLASWFWHFPQEHAADRSHCNTAATEARSTDRMQCLRLYIYMNATSQRLAVDS